MKGAGIEKAAFTVLLDIRQPQAWLALHPAAEFAAALGVEPNWLPVVVPPLKAPSEPHPGDDRGVRHRRYRAEAIAREIQTYAAARNLVIEGYYRDPDPRLYNLCWLWVREHRPASLFEFLRRTFEAYWARDLDIEDAAAMSALLEPLGCDARRFDEWVHGPGPAAADAVAEDVRARGVTRSPAYLVEEQVFIGRQHLPMIRWILEGCPESGPV